MALAAVTLAAGGAVATSTAAPTEAEAAERAYFRIVDHPRVEKFVTQGSPSAPWLLKTRIDALWDPRHTGEVEISIQIVRKSGNKWVASGPPATRSDSDGNLTVFAEGVAQPGGPYEYAAQWNARAKGARSGVEPWSRPNERGPAIQFKTPNGKVTPPSASPVLTPRALPNGCSQQAVPFKSHADREAATGYVIMHCSQARSHRPDSITVTSERCNLPHAGGVLPCGGWHKIAEKTRVLPADTANRVTGKPWPGDTLVVEVTIPTEYEVGNVRHRLNATTRIQQLPHPPLIAAILRYDLRAESFLRGDWD